MTLTAKHVECAQVCDRLEVAGKDTKEMAKECGVGRSTINGSPGRPFWPRKPEPKAAFRVDLSDIPLTHRRDRIEALAEIAGAEDAKYDTRIRAIKSIADETAADVEGMIESLQEQVGLL